MCYFLSKAFRFLFLNRHQKRCCLQLVALALRAFFLTAENLQLSSKGHSEAFQREQHYRLLYLELNLFLELTQRLAVL